MFPLGRSVLRRSVVVCNLLENKQIPAAEQLYNRVKTLQQRDGNYMFVRGLKTTDTTHPKPIYDDDERILKKVLEERHQQTEDLPVGMVNPYEKPQKKCILCEYGITPDYKNVKLLYQFVSPYTGMLFDRHVTGLCKKKQEQVEWEVGRAVRAGLMSNYLKEVEFIKDPKLCDPERPIRPHKY